jgi:peptidoglycan/LPS O-acetylase OafA/YrhL
MLVKGFSAYTNTTKLIKITTSTPDQLPCLNGLKCLSMVWIVAGHQFSVPKYMLEWIENLYSMIIVSGTLSVDTFFTIGGALMSYSFLKARCKNTPFNLFLYFLHRYLR